MKIGPVQLIVINFETTEKFRGEILRELEAIRTRGVIRLIDLLFVAKDEAGEITALGGTWLDQEEKAQFGALIGALIGYGEAGVDGAAEGAAAGALMPENVMGITSADARALADEIPPGTAAALMLFEHTWATQFSQAIRDAGGQMVAQGFLTREAMFMMGEEMEAIAEAELVVQEAELTKAQAQMDALSAVTAARLIEDAAAQEAAEAVAMAEAVKAAAATDALRALTVAGLIEAAAMQEAIDALVAADLIQQEARI